jgi:hypothetical protein
MMKIKKISALYRTIPSPQLLYSVICTVDAIMTMNINVVVLYCTVYCTVQVIYKVYISQINLLFLKNRVRTKLPTFLDDSVPFTPAPEST